MAPRKRTTTEPQDAAADLAPKKEAKPKAAKSIAKKATKAEPKLPEAPLEMAEPVRRKPGRPAKVAATPKVALEVVPEVTPAPKVSPKSRTTTPSVTEPKPITPVKVVEAPRQAPSFTPHAQKVMEAIAEGRAIELIFLDGDANPPRTFEARQLIYDIFTGSWFAWGWDRRYNAERHHRLDQLAEINPVDGPGRSAQGPFTEGTPANQIGGWRGGEAIPVKAVLQKQWIFAVKQAPAPFPDFLLQDIEEGKAQVTFTGTDLRAIARWCMQFGEGIQIQEPQRLVDRMKQVGIAWAGKAAAALPPPPPHRTQPRADHRPEPKPEPRPEPRAETRPEPRPEPRRHESPRKEPREAREPREQEAPKGRPARIEVRIERL